MNGIMNDFARVQGGLLQKHQKTSHELKHRDMLIHVFAELYKINTSDLWT